jgi:hypothetical protein
MKQVRLCSLLLFVTEETPYTIARIIFSSESRTLKLYQTQTTTIQARRLLAESIL